MCVNPEESVVRLWKHLTYYKKNKPMIKIENSSLRFWGLEIMVGLKIIISLLLEFKLICRYFYFKKLHYHSSLTKLDPYPHVTVTYYESRVSSVRIVYFKVRKPKTIKGSCILLQLLLNILSSPCYSAIFGVTKKKS